MAYRRFVAVVILLAAGAVTSVTAQQSTPSSTGAMRQGVKVHGRWTIEVRNPDGSTVSRHEFDNALDLGVVGGSSLLAGVLGRQYTPGTWSIRLDSPVPGGIGGAPGPCSGDQPCVLTEPANPVGGSNPIFHRTLSIRVPTSVVGPRPLPTGTLELTGHATMATARPITRVATQLGLCAPAVPVAECGSGTAAFTETFGFTAHTLPSAVEVSVGQIVQVTVVISFS